MKKTLTAGMTFEFAYSVPENKTVPHLYPEIEDLQAMPRVFATGFMVGLFEYACIQALMPYLDWPREQTVGIHVNLSHNAPTPPGMTVTIRGKLEKMEGRKLLFALAADDGIDKISEGTHIRYIIDREKFDSQVAAKTAKAREPQPAKKPVDDKRMLDILDKAIRREEEAYTFYTDLSVKIQDPAVRETIEWIANEEKNHKRFLLNYRDGNYPPEAFRMADVVHYRIAEHLEEPEAETGMESQDIYLLASHRELRSYKFYTELARIHPEGKIRALLLRMANEELKHKEKMEYLYTNTAFPQTDGG